MRLVYGKKTKIFNLRETAGLFFFVETNKECLFTLAHTHDDLEN